MKKFVYKERTVEDLESRTISGGDFDKTLKDFVKVFKPSIGKNRIRILPPTWDDPHHYGYDVWMVYNIGPDNQCYLSLNKMGKGNDPIYEEYKKAKAEGREEDAKNLAAKKRVMVYVIDRKHEEEGPLVWFMPKKVDIDICSTAEDPDTGSILNVDSPDNGYDIIFTKEGEKLLTKYPGVSIARTSTPISTDNNLVDKWIDYIVENPLPSLLNYYSYDHIKSVFNGELAKKPKNIDEGSETLSQQKNEEFDKETGEILYEKETEEVLPLVKATVENEVTKSVEETPAQRLRARMEARRAKRD